MRPGSRYAPPARPAADLLTSAVSSDLGHGNDVGGHDELPSSDRMGATGPGPAQAGRVEGSPSLRWSHDTVRSTVTLATMRLLSMVSTSGRSSSV